MDISEKIQKISRLANVHDIDLISDVLSISQEAILSRRFPFEDTHGQTVPIRYNQLQIRMCVEMVSQHKRGENIAIPPKFLDEIMPRAKIL